MVVAGRKLGGRTNAKALLPAVCICPSSRTIPPTSLAAGVRPPPPGAAQPFWSVSCENPLAEIANVAPSSDVKQVMSGLGSRNRHDISLYVVDQPVLPPGDQIASRTLWPCQGVTSS